MQEQTIRPPLRVAQLYQSCVESVPYVHDRCDELIKPCVGAVGLAGLRDRIGV